MQLLPDWKRLLTRAWSVWCLYAMGLMNVLPLLFEFDLPWWADTANIVLIFLALAARVSAQKAFADE